MELSFDRIGSGGAKIQVLTGAQGNPYTPLTVTGVEINPTRIYAFADLLPGNTCNLGIYPVAAAVWQNGYGRMTYSNGSTVYGKNCTFSLSGGTLTITPGVSNYTFFGGGARWSVVLIED